MRLLLLLAIFSVLYPARSQDKPVVDTLQEHEKYGNDGGTFRGLGQGFLRTSQSISSKIGEAIGSEPEIIPSDASKSITQFFNRIGHAIVGL